jgi:hypothetical protein
VNEKGTNRKPLGIASRAQEHPNRGAFGLALRENAGASGVVRQSFFVLGGGIEGNPRRRALGARAYEPAVTLGRRDRILPPDEAPALFGERKICS